MSDKSQALSQIKALIGQHGITLEDIKNIMSSPSHKKGGQVSRLFYYIGGIFIFAGLGVFTSMFWDVIGFGGQVIITLGVGFMCYLMAVLATKDARYDKLATPLFLISSFLQPTGIMLVLENYSTGSNAAMAVLFTAGLMLIQQVFTFLSTKRSVLLFTSMVFYGFVVASGLDVFDILSGDLEIFGVALGISYLTICAKCVHTQHHAITPFWFFIGSFLIMSGFYEIVDGSMFSLLFLGLSAFIVYLSTIFSSRTMLFNGTIGLLWYIGEFSYDFFEDSIGWPLVLVIMGVSCIGLGSFALKLSKRMSKG